MNRDLVFVLLLSLTGVVSVLFGLLSTLLARSIDDDSHFFSDTFRALINQVGHRQRQDRRTHR